MSERIILHGSEETLKPVITQILAIHQLIEYRDIGQFLGSPAGENVQAEKKGISARFFFFTKPEPPWDWNAVVGKYRIPNIDRIAIQDWQRVKSACGGANGYQWGRFRASLGLDTGHRIQVLGATASEAEERAVALAGLSESEIVTMSVSEEKREGKRREYPHLYKEAIRLYPGYMTLLNTQYLAHLQQTNRTEEKKEFIKTRAKLELWRDEQPIYWDSQLSKLLKKAQSEA